MTKKSSTFAVKIISTDGISRNIPFNWIFPNRLVNQCMQCIPRELPIFEIAHPQTILSWTGISKNGKGHRLLLSRYSKRQITYIDFDPQRPIQKTSTAFHRSRTSVCHSGNARTWLCLRWDKSGHGHRRNRRSHNTDEPWISSCAWTSSGFSAENLR